MSERELAKYPGLVRRDGGVWYVRRRVPDDLRHILGSSDIRRSLRTSNSKEAVGRYHSEMVGLTQAGGGVLYVNPLQVEAVSGTFEDDHAVIHFYWNTRSVMVQGDPESVRALLDEGLA